ncbi:hypothetical protein ACFW04_003044 [Cataglyphis niger]
MWLVVPLLLLFAVYTYRADDEIETNEIDGHVSAAPSEAQHNAVQAYLEENWDNITGFNDALHEYPVFFFCEYATFYRYKMYKRMVMICSRKCKDIEDLFYERKVRETLCLMKCNQDYREIAGAKTLKRLLRVTKEKLANLTIYERFYHLHICYFQKGRYQNAANAGFTFLFLHPNHEMVTKNLKYYLELPDVIVKEIVILEALPFIQIFMRRLSPNLTSLEFYMEFEENCRKYCERSFDQGWYPEFTSSIANHFAFCLKCKRGCSLAMNNVNGNFLADLLRSHYNYLQFAYYKCNGQSKNSLCSSCELFIISTRQRDNILQYNDYIIYNNDYYSSQSKVEKEYFTPRKYSSSIHLPGHSSFTRTQFVGNLSIFRKKNGTEKELGGKNCYAADGFHNSIECDLLMQLTQVNEILRVLIVSHCNVYEENKSPYSPYECFEGVIVDEMASIGIVVEHTEEVHDHVEKYLDPLLYFTYTHLVCQMVLPNSPMDRMDLSHEIHADNCVIKDGGFCLREDPAYTGRNYSTILYLNDDFDDISTIYSIASFFFIVRLRCGRMVALSVGGENLHEVQGVCNNKRCAYERVVANIMLTRVCTLGIATRGYPNTFQVKLLLSGKIYYYRYIRKDLKEHLLVRALYVYEDMLIQCFKEDEMLRNILKEGKGNKKSILVEI